MQRVFIKNLERPGPNVNGMKNSSLVVTHYNSDVKSGVTDKQEHKSNVQMKKMENVDNVVKKKKKVPIPAELSIRRANDAHNVWTSFSSDLLVWLRNSTFSR